MGAPVFAHLFAQDIHKPVNTQHGGGLVFTGDAFSDSVSVALYDGDTPLSFTGSVVGSAIRADGYTVEIDTGTITGNVATITLNASCFVVPGPLSVVITISDSTIVTTALRVTFTVVETETGTIVDPGSIVPNVDAIRAEYANMQAAVAEAEAAAETAGSSVDMVGNIGRLIMVVDGSDRITLGDMAGGTVNPANGKDQTMTYGCKLKYSAITGPILMAVEPTAEMQSLLPQGVKVNVWKYSGSTVGSAQYSVTGKTWTTAAVPIPYDGWSTENIRVGFASIDETIALAPATDPDVAARLAAIKASLKIYKLTDSGLDTAGAPADSKATGDAIDAAQTEVERGPMDKATISLSMIQTAAVIGDSYASGHLDSTKGDNYAQSWIQVLARQYGFDAANYSRGGINSSEWLTHANGLPKMQADIPRQLYFVALGINDAADSLTIGTISDFSTEPQTPTFYGNLGKISRAIKAKNAGAVICYITPARLGSAYTPYATAIAAAAEEDSALLIESEDLGLMTASAWPTGSHHPTAAQYAQMAEAYARAFEMTATAADLSGYNSMEPSMSIRALEADDSSEALAWEQGTISSSGTIQDNTTRCRTPGASAPQATSDLGFLINVPSGMKVYVMTYIGIPNYSGFIGPYIAEWQTGQVNVTLPAGRYIRLVGAKTDDSNVTPEDMTGITITRRGYTDRTLTLADKAADAKTVGEKYNALGALLVSKGLISQSEWEAL